MEKVVVEEYGDPSVLQVRDGPPPDPGPGEVLVDVEAVGVNWADVVRRRGDYHGGSDPPFTPGFEAAGTVAATGAAVDRWAVGDEVVGGFEDGAYAGKAVTEAHRLFAKPDGEDVTTAAGTFVHGLTAHNLVHEWGQVSAEETVLVHAAATGAGPKVVQLAAAAGATVVGTASTDEKLAFAADSGADYTVDAETEDVPATVTELAGSVDVVFDGVGGRAFYESFDCLATGGRIVVHGAASGNVPTVATPRLYHDNLSVIGYDLKPALDHQRETVSAAKADLDERLADGTFDPQITDVRPLSEAAAVHRELEVDETTGKIVLVPE